MENKQQTKDFLLNWNYFFPFDRLWRKRYNIPLFSKEHLDSNQLDITLEFLEDDLFSSLNEKAKEQSIREIDYHKEGKLFREGIEKDSDKEIEDLFFETDISKFNE